MSFVSQSLKATFASRRYKLLAILFGISYAISYMFITGIIVYASGLRFPGTVNPPFVMIQTDGPLGRYPLIQMLITNELYLSISIEAIIFLVASSSLVAIVLALLMQSKKQCSCKEAYGLGSMGILSGFFTLFACCGGGIILLVLGPLAFANLIPFSTHLETISLAALAAAVFVLSRKIYITSK